MHIPDGFLSPQLTIPSYIATIPLWLYSAKKHFGPKAVERLPVVGSLTAMAFAIQSIMIPIPGGTSAHLAGCALLALLYNPFVSLICETLVLLIQALFFGAGGLTVLPFNALAMGFFGPLSGWLLFRVTQRLGSGVGGVGAFLAAYLSMQVSHLCIALALGLQHWLSAKYFPIPLRAVIPVMMLPSLAITGFLEGGYTLIVLALLRKAKLRGVQP